MLQAVVENALSRNGELIHGSRILEPPPPASRYILDATPETGYTELVKQPQNLQEAIAYFSDAGVAEKYLAEARWPSGPACPRRGCSTRDVRSISRRRYRCGRCGKDFTAKAGTIFEDSPLGLEIWLPAIWLLANSKSAVSSMELHRALGVTQKTAWFMLRRARSAMSLR